MKVIKSEDDDPTESGVQPTLRIEDLRGEINSFEIMGPKAGLVLQGVTSLCKSENGSKRKVGYDLTPMWQLVVDPGDRYLALVLVGSEWVTDFRERVERYGCWSSVT